ncbi:hypothetical protein PYCC9005_005279 [Savitreella phatthalungensis]
MPSRQDGTRMFRRMPSRPKPGTKAKAAPSEAESHAVATLRNTCQTFLSLLEARYGEIVSARGYNAKLQSIKGYFFRREYDQVFNDAELAKIYALRYMPSRALAYAQLFQDKPILDLLYPPVEVNQRLRPSERKQLKQQEAQIHESRQIRRITAVGAGVGSELCALQLLHQFVADEEANAQQEDEDDSLPTRLNVDLQLDVVDYADYETFLVELGENDDNGPVVNYHRQSVLEWSSSPEFATLLSRTHLLTFMFVFNELFAASKTKTMALIGACLKFLPVGAHVLLVESAGDLSEVQLAGGDAGVMVYKFWDHLPGFEQVYGLDRRWYRVDKQLRYSLDMENVAYFARVYRRL